MKLIQSILFIIAMATTCVVRAHIATPSDPIIKKAGRIVNGADGSAHFNFPGVWFDFDFTGPQLEMATSPGAGSFVVEVDTLNPYKITVNSTDSIVKLADSLTEGRHHARVIYCQEGFEFNPIVKTFGAAKGQILASDWRPSLKIEFIGNSITCGYGTEATEGNIPFSYDTENHTLSYAYRTAKNLNAQSNIVARSGIGVYRNYGGPTEGSPDKTMPCEYDNTMLYNPEIKWDFNSFRPDIICINLGTNDLSTEGYDESRLFDCYTRFVDHIQCVNPGSKIILLTGSMLRDEPLEVQRRVVDKVASTHEGILRFDMTPQTGELGYGADYHPSAAQAEKMADELTGFIKSLLAPHGLGR